MESFKSTPHWRFVMVKRGAAADGAPERIIVVQNWHDLQELALIGLEGPCNGSINKK